MNKINSFKKLSDRKLLILPSIITVSLCSLFAIQIAHAEDPTSASPVVENLINKSISVDTTSGGGSGSYTTLDSVIIKGLSANDYKIKFKDSAKFEFNTTLPVITGSSLAVTGLSCTNLSCKFSLGDSDIGGSSNIEISGIQVRPTVTGITSTFLDILGLGTTYNLGTVNTIAGDAAKLNLEIPAASQASTYGDALSFTVKIQDKFGNDTKTSAPDAIGIYIRTKDGDTRIGHELVNDSTVIISNNEGRLDAGDYVIVAKAVGLAIESPVQNIKVNKKELRINLQANEKIYDGNTTAAFKDNVNPSIDASSVISGDEVGLDLTNAHFSFENANVGSRKAVLSGVVLSGNQKDNYVLPNEISATANITAKDVVITPNANIKKTYGDDDSIFTYASNGLIGDDKVEGKLICTPIVAGKKIGVCDFGIGNLTASSNYKLNLVATPAQGEIIAKAIVITPKAGQKKVYGTEDPTFQYDYTPALVSGDNFSGNISRVGDNNVGEYIFELDTLTAGENYALSLAANSPKFTIEKKAVVITPIPSTKVYGENDPEFTYEQVTLVGTTDALTGKISRETGDNVGDYKFTLGTLSAGGNYELSVAENPKFTITPKAITIAPNEGQSKVYGSSDPESFTYTPSVALVTGNSFSGKLSRAVGQDVGGYDFTIGDLSAGRNYILSLSGVNKFQITAKPVTVIATAENKTYDATDLAVVHLSSSDLIAADNVTIASTEARFANKNVEPNKVVTVKGISLVNNDKGNYSLPNITATTKANITAKPIAVTVAVDNKTYDGTTNAVISTRTLDSVISGDIVSAKDGIATFADKNVGDNKRVSVTGLAYDGADAGNYSITVNALITANIIKRAIIVNPVADSRVYNGNNSSNKTPVVDVNTPVVGGDTANFIQVFENKNVGVNKPIKVEGKVNDGNNGGNYSYTLNTANIGEITAYPMIITAVYDKKVYDGKANSNKVPVITGALQGGDIASNPPIQMYQSEIAGNGRVINVISYFINDGNDGKNYAVTYIPFKSGEIEKAPITISGIVSTPKDYDGNNTATVNYDNAVIDGIIGTDGREVSFIKDAAVALYDNKNAGQGKAVTIKGIVLNGRGSANYSIPASITINDGVINKLGVIVSPNPDQKKVYGAADPDKFTYTLDKVIDETLVLKREGGENKGSYSYVIDGNGQNYNFIINGSAPKFEITAKPITVTATAQSKVYDGADVAKVTLSSIDNVEVVSDSARFDNADVGSNKVVTVSGIALKDRNNQNYVIANVDNKATANAEITAKPLTVVVETENKTYDGLTTGVIKSRTLSGVIGTDDVSAIGGTAVFSDVNAGDDKVVSVSGLTLDGVNKGNYSLNGQVESRANILKKEITIKPVADTKKFDNTKNSTTTPVLNDGSTLVANDKMTAVQEYKDELVGTKKLSVKSVVIKNGVVDVTSNYEIKKDATVDGVIEKATPTITWVTPVGIVAGTALTKNQLNASAKGVGDVALEGAYAYTPDFGTVLNNVGANNLKVVFTPANPNYSTSEKTVSINVSAQSAPSNSGGGGGGGGGSYSSPKTVQTIKASAVAPAQSIDSGLVLGASSFNFTRDLSVGSKGDDVVELQNFLRGKGYFAPESSGYFGLKTKEALQKYQKDSNIPAFGYFGKMTREKISGEQNILASAPTSTVSALDNKVIVSKILSIIKEIKSRLTSKEEIEKYNQLEATLLKEQK